MKNHSKIPKSGTVPDLTERKLAVGTKQLKKAVNAGLAKQVYLAQNADPALTGPLAELCGQRNIQITWVHSMTALGHACGIEVGAAAAAVLD